MTRTWNIQDHEARVFAMSSRHVQRHKFGKKGKQVGCRISLGTKLPRNFECLHILISHFILAVGINAGPAYTNPTV